MEYNMTTGYAILPFGVIFLVTFLGISLVIAYFIIAKKHKKNLPNNVFIKNIFINIGLIILSGILYIVFEKIVEKIYVERWPSPLIGIIAMFYILFSNFIGLIFSIIYSKKLHIVFLNYGIFIISTIIIYNLINIIVILLKNNNIISMSSSIINILILIILENIFSYLFVKITTKYKVRGNFA
jgi:hypothetical protein